MAKKNSRNNQGRSGRRGVMTAAVNQGGRTQTFGSVNRPTQTPAPSYTQSPSPSPAPSGGLSYNGAPIQDGITYQLNDAGTGIVGIVPPGSPGTPGNGPGYGGSQTSAPSNINTDGVFKYGIGKQKAARDNYKLLIDQGYADAFDPGRPGSRANIMADGFVSKKELKKFANRKDLDAARGRKRLSNKGAAFTAGANKLADAAFLKANPFLAMMIRSGVEGPYGDMTAGMKKGKGRMLQQYKDSSSYDYKNRLPGEVFRFRPKYGMQGGTATPDYGRLRDILSNPIVGTDPIPTPTPTPTPTTVGTEGTDQIDETTTTDGTTTDGTSMQGENAGAGMLSGGGLGALGASKLGRARSRLQRLGILGRGTSLLGRGLQYGNALNA